MSALKLHRKCSRNTKTLGSLVRGQLFKLQGADDVYMRGGGNGEYVQSILIYPPNECGHQRVRNTTKVIPIEGELIIKE